MKKVTVYGSLLKGLGNHRVLGDSKMVSEETLILPFKMTAFGSSFPGLFTDEKNHKIHTETYEVDDATYKRVESLEGYPSFYDKFPVETSVGPSEIYFLNGERDAIAIEKIDNVFNWKKHLNNEKIS